MSINFIGEGATHRLHSLLWLYNALASLLLALFFCVTQQKIVSSMAGHAFLLQLPALPVPALEGLCSLVAAFLALLALSRLFHREEKRTWLRLAALLGEAAACVAIMRSLNLSYDGVVLLVAADIMYSYDGRRVAALLGLAMLGLYFLAAYNLAVFQGAVAPFEAYSAYYSAPARGVLLASRSALSSINIILFAAYLVFLVQSKHLEKERIASLNAKLAEANEQLKLYAREAEEAAKMRERNRLAREIHDTLGHTLTALAAGLDASLVLLDLAPEKGKEQLKKLQQTARSGLTDVRRSVRRLRPEDLERMPLEKALKKMADEFSQNTGMKIELEISLNAPEGYLRLRGDEEETIYRVVQEALTNAHRHGRAKTASVTIRAAGGNLLMRIMDDGKGCLVPKPGFGLRHMRERLELLGGSLTYQSGAGFFLTAQIPLTRGKEDEHD